MYDEYLKAKQAYVKVERKFSSGNGVDVERATITKEEWELVNKHFDFLIDITNAL